MRCVRQRDLAVAVLGLGDVCSRIVPVHIRTGVHIGHPVGHLVAVADVGVPTITVCAILLGTGTPSVIEQRPQVPPEIA